MRLWQYVLLLGVLGHHSRACKSGKAIVTKDCMIIPRHSNMKVCLYSDNHVTVYDSSAQRSLCDDAVQKVLSECCCNLNQKNDGKENKPEPSNQLNSQCSDPNRDKSQSHGPFVPLNQQPQSNPNRYPQSYDPSNQHVGKQQRTNEPTGSNQYHQLYDPNNPPRSSSPLRSQEGEQGQCKKPTPQPQLLDHDSQKKSQSHGTLIPQNHRLEPQNNEYQDYYDPSNQQRSPSYSQPQPLRQQYPQLSEQHGGIPNEQIMPSSSSNFPNTQQHQSCNRPAGPTQQHQQRNPSHQQGPLQPLNQHYPQSSDPNRQSRGNPNGQSMPSGSSISPYTPIARPCNRPAGPTQQHKPHDPSHQQGPQSFGPLQPLNQQYPPLSDPNRQSGGNPNGQNVPSGSSGFPNTQQRQPCNRQAGPTQQQQQRDPSHQQGPQSRGPSQPLNQNYPQSSDPNRQGGGIPNGQNMPPGSSSYPNTQQRQPCNRPSGPTQQHKPRDPSHQQGPQSRGPSQPLNQNYPHSSDPNRGGGGIQNAQNEPSGSSSFPNTQQRQPCNRPAGPTQQHQQRDPSHQQGPQSRGPSQPLNQNYPQSSDPNRQGGGIPNGQNMPPGSSSYPNTQQRQPCNRPSGPTQQHKPRDPSHQQGPQSRGPSQPLNQNYPHSSDPNRGGGGIQNAQNEPSGSSSFPNTQQRQPCNRPAGPTQQHQQRDPRHQQGPQSPGPSQPLNQNYPQSSDPNRQGGGIPNEQNEPPGSSNFPNIQRRKPFNRPAGPTQQYEPRDPINPQGPHSRGPLQPLNQQYPQLSDPNKHSGGNPTVQNMPSGSSSFPNTQQRQPCNRPAGPTQQHQQRDPNHQQGPQSRGPSLPLNQNYPQPSDPNRQGGGIPNEQNEPPGSSNFPNIQRRKPCNRPAGPTQQYEPRDPINPQGPHSRGPLQPLNQQYPQLSDPNRQSGGNPTGQNMPSGSSSFPNTQQRQPCNRPAGPTQQHQQRDPSHQQGPQSPGPSQPLNQNYPQSSDPNRQGEGIPNEQNEPPGSSNFPNIQRRKPCNRLAGPTQQYEPRDPINPQGPYSREPLQPLNQQYPQLSDPNRQSGGNPNGQNMPSGSSSFPNTQQRQPCNRPAGPTQQHQQRDTSHQQGPQSRGPLQPLNQQYPQLSDPNRQGGGIPNEQNEPPGSSNFPNIQRRQPCNRPAGPTQQHQQRDPSHQQGPQSRGPLQPLNQQYPQLSDPNRQSGGKSNEQIMPSGSSNFPNTQRGKSCNRPIGPIEQLQSHDPSNQQRPPSRGPPQSLNPQYLQQPGSLNTQERPSAEANSPLQQKPSQSCCPDGKKPLIIGCFRGHFEMCGNQVKWMLDAIEKCNSLQENYDRHVKSRRIALRRNLEENHKKNRRPPRAMRRNIMYDPGIRQPQFGARRIPKVNRRRRPIWFTNM